MSEEISDRALAVALAWWEAQLWAREELERLAAQDGSAGG